MSSSAIGSTRSPRVVLVAQNASTRFGGESILPWHYFRLLRKRGIDAHLVVHERTRSELIALLPEESEHMHFVPDLPAQRLLWRMGAHLPPRIQENTVGIGLHAATSMMQRKAVRALVQKHQIDVVHEPIPVSPKQPSFMFGLGAPLVIGPMNGGMDFPPAFSGNTGLTERVIMSVGRQLSHAVNVLIPGKKEAAILLTANLRTTRALPRSASRNVVQLVENGVDLTVFGTRKADVDSARPRCRFIFVGRLVDWKRVDLLLEACAQLERDSFELHILGEGPMRPSLETQCAALGLSDHVVFHGQVAQSGCSEQLLQCDALVLPSLRECGGAVVLEAMASGLPVIATNWGGPADYLDAHTGILVEPTNHPLFVTGLTNAMRDLSSSPELRARLGAAGRQKVIDEFDWERKIDRILEIYAQAIQANSNTSRNAQNPSSLNDG